MERSASETNNSWADLGQIGDFMARELAKKLELSDIRSLRGVNSTWRSFFSTDDIWKPLLEFEYPFEALNVTQEYIKQFAKYSQLYNRIACAHPNASRVGAERICPCVETEILRNKATNQGIARQYTGRKTEYFYCLPTYDEDCKCREKIPTREYFTFPLVCKECMDLILGDGAVGSFTGLSELQTRWLHAEWIHQEFKFSTRIHRAQAVGPNQYVALTDDKTNSQVLLLTIDGQNITEEVLLQSEQLPSVGTGLEVSPNGRYFAVYQIGGTQGVVYNIADRRITFKFEREDYHAKNSSFPVAFFVHEGRTLLIAAKEWNYLEVYDPESGEELRKRDVSENHLELFWCSLVLSPDYKHACSLGWVWHPIGMFVDFSVSEWMTSDIFASDKAKYGMDSEIWDTPLCFISNDVVAIWALNTIPNAEKDKSHQAALHGFNVKTRRLTDFAVPIDVGDLVFDEYLYSLSPSGIELIDPTHSFVYQVENSITYGQCPCYNRHSKQFLGRKSKDDLTLVLSHIRRH